MAAGGLASLAPPREIVTVVAVALVGAAATLLCDRLRSGPPGGLMFAFATAVSGAVSVRVTDLPRNLGLVAAAAAVAWLVVNSGALIRPATPRRLAVARALRASAALHAAPPGPAGLQARKQAALAVERAWRAVSSTGPGEGERLRVLVAHAETELSGVHGHTAAAAAELRGLAARVLGRGPVPEVVASETDSVTLAERGLAAILLRDRGVPMLRRPLWPAALRVAVGALIAGSAAGLLTQVTGLGHPYWAAVSAVAVLQAASLRVSFQRAVQRAGGTIAGLLLAGAAVTVPGGPWVLVAEVVVAQVIAELLVIRNYGLAMLAVTPLALLVGELGHPTPPPDLIGDRVVQTVLGCSLGLVAAALVRNRAATRHLEATVEALEGLDGVRETRTVDLLGVMRDAYEVVAGEPGLDADLTERVLRAEAAARSALTVSRAAAGVSTLEDAPQRKETVMTSTPGLPPVGLLLGIDNDENDGADNGPVVGASDAEADAAASGAPADLEHPTHDSDGTPVGRADLDEDRRASGA